MRSTPSFTDWTVLVTRHDGKAWSPPQVASFSGTYRDADPYVTDDGRHLYFISDRPVEGTSRKGMDVWVMDLEEGGAWGTPRNLGEPVNSAGNEWYPKLSVNGTLYFGSDRPGGHGGTDLYRCRMLNGTFAEPENLGPAVNSAAEEYEPCIAPDESFLVFMAAGRPDDRGNGDLYLSFRNNGQWTTAAPLDSTINGPGLEISPYLSPNGRYFFFSSARRAEGIPQGARPNQPANGLGDIYQMELKSLLKER